MIDEMDEDEVKIPNHKNFTIQQKYFQIYFLVHLIYPII